MKKVGGCVGSYGKARMRQSKGGGTEDSGDGGREVVRWGQTEKRIEFGRRGKRKKSQEQQAIITSDPPWYSIELVY